MRNHEDIPTGGLSPKRPPLGPPEHHQTLPMSFDRPLGAPSPHDTLRDMDTQGEPHPVPPLFGDNSRDDELQLPLQPELDDSPRLVPGPPIPGPEAGLDTRPSGLDIVTPGMSGPEIGTSSGSLHPVGGFQSTITTLPSQPVDTMPPRRPMPVPGGPLAAAAAAAGMRGGRGNTGLDLSLTGTGDVYAEPPIKAGPSYDFEGPVATAAVAYATVVAAVKRKVQFEPMPQDKQGQYRGRTRKASTESIGSISSMSEGEPEPIGVGPPTDPTSHKELQLGHNITMTQAVTILRSQPIDVQRRMASQHTFSLRALIIGLLIGALLSFQSMYFFLRSGISFPGTFTATLVGWIAIRLLSAPHAQIFSAQEHCFLTSVAVATGVGATAFGFSGPMLAITTAYTRAANSPPGTPSLDIPWYGLLLFCLVLSVIGLCLAVPLRERLIIRSKLPFPSGRATAVMMASFQLGQADSRGSGKLMLGTSLVSFFIKVLRAFLPGIDTIPIFGRRALCYGWYWDWSTAFIGSALIMPLNVPLGVAAGSVLATVLGSFLLTKEGEWFPKKPNWKPIPGYTCPQSLSQTNLETVYGYIQSVAVAILCLDGLILLVETLYKESQSSSSSSVSPADGNQPPPALPGQASAAGANQDSSAADPEITYVPPQYVPSEPIVADQRAAESRGSAPIPIAKSLTNRDAEAHSLVRDPSLAGSLPDGPLLRGPSFLAHSMNPKSPSAFSVPGIGSHASDGLPALPGLTPATKQRNDGQPLVAAPTTGAATQVVLPEPLPATLHVRPGSVGSASGLSRELTLRAAENAQRLAAIAAGLVDYDDLEVPQSKTTDRRGSPLLTSQPWNAGGELIQSQSMVAAHPRTLFEADEAADRLEAEEQMRLARRQERAPKQHAHDTLNIQSKGVEMRPQSLMKQNYSHSLGAQTEDHHTKFRTNDLPDAYDTYEMKYGAPSIGYMKLIPDDAESLPTTHSGLGGIEEEVEVEGDHAEEGGDKVISSASMMTSISLQSDADSLIGQESGNTAQAKCTTFLQKYLGQWWQRGLFISAIGILIFLPLLLHWCGPDSAKLNFELYGATLISLAVAPVLAMVVVYTYGKADQALVTFGGKVVLALAAAVSQDSIVGLALSTVGLAVCVQVCENSQMLKTAHILRASPKAILWGQLVGSLCSAPIAVLAYLLFSKVYRLPDVKAGFEAPVASLFRTMAALFATDSAKLPKYYWAFMLGGAFYVILYRLVRWFADRHERRRLAEEAAGLRPPSDVVDVYQTPLAFIKRYWYHLFPAPFALALGFYMPSVIAIDFLVGAAVKFIWLRRSRATFTARHQMIAAGMISGEGIAGVCMAFLLLFIKVNWYISM